jgi:hypothetical protein
MRISRRREKTGKDGEMRRIGKITRRMPLFPPPPVAIEDRRPTRRLFLHGHIITKRIKTYHQYILSPYYFLHSYIHTSKSADGKDTIFLL